MAYYSTAENLADLADKIDEISVDHYNLPNSFSLFSKKDDIFKSAFLMLLSSFEGFLNILYELYLQPELRSDRLFERISREQVDIKLRLARFIVAALKLKLLIEKMTDSKII